MVQTFGEIRTALTRLDALVQDYLSLVRVGTIELDVQDRGRRAWTAEMQSRAEQQGVTVELEGHATVGPLAFHPSTLRRAVLNAVQNAIEAMPEGVRCAWSVPAPATEVHAHPRSWDRYARRAGAADFRAAYTTKPGGTGLGLYIVRRFWSRMGDGWRWRAWRGRAPPLS